MHGDSKKGNSTKSKRRKLRHTTKKGKYMKYDLEGKTFKLSESTDNGEVNSDTIFRYHQDGENIWAKYDGGSIRKGYLLGKMQENGTLEFACHHINHEGSLSLGQCVSAPTMLSDGRLKDSEKWQWLTGGKSSGSSEVIEIDSA